MNNSQQATRWFQLRPVDAWFFRDGRPSNRGEDQSDLESQFPPNAATVVGALRAALARQCDHDWDGHSDWPEPIKAVLGDGNDLGQLAFTGPLLEKEGQTLFPMPRHVLGRFCENGDERTFKPCDWLAPSPQPVPTDIGDILLPQPIGLCSTPPDKKRPEPADGFWVTTVGMEKILNGKLPATQDCIYRDQLFVRESRVGIQRDAETRTTGDGAIYSPQYVRLRSGVALLVGITGLPAAGWNLPSYFPLGGESRLASCEPIDEPIFPRRQAGAKTMVLVLATPANFSAEPWWGAGPGCDANKLDSNISGNVITATFDRPLGIGGWDSVNRQPLPLTPYVRPGAVWWFDSGANGSEANGSGRLQLGRNTAHGYGLTFLGAAPSLKQ